MSVVPLRGRPLRTVDVLATRHGLDPRDVLELLADVEPASIVNGRPHWPTWALLAGARRRLGRGDAVQSHERGEVVAARELDALLADHRREIAGFVDGAREVLAMLDELRTDALGRIDLDDEQRDAIAAHFDGADAIEDLRRFVAGGGRTVG